MAALTRRLSLAVITLVAIASVAGITLASSALAGDSVAVTTVETPSNQIRGGMASREVDPQQLVLSPADVPVGYQYLRSGYLSPTSGSDFDPAERLSDFFVSYVKDTKYNQITTETSVYSSAARAHAALLAAARRLPSAYKPLLPAPKLGLEAQLRTYSSKGYTLYVLLWRSGAIDTELAVGGSTAGVSAAMTKRLAQRQQVRIAARS